MKTLLATIFLMLTSHSAFAGLIFSQELDSNIGFESIFSNTGGQVVADQFILSRDSIITDISWYGYFRNDLGPSVSPLNFQLEILSNDLGLPSSIPTLSQVSLASVSSTGQLVNEGFFSGQAIYQFSASLSAPLTLSAGDSNWLSIANDFSSNEFNEWLWGESPTNSVENETIAFMNTNPDLPTDWVAVDNRNLAFSLHGEVARIPEPPVILLLIAGLFALGLARHRRV